MRDPILQSPDPVLRQVAKAVAKKDFASTALKKLVSRMKTILEKEENGVALAAPQVGESLRLFIVSPRAYEKPDEDSGEKPQPKERPLIFINPKLLRVSRKKREMSEGCLSVRGSYGTVERHEKASVEAHDDSGKKFTYHGAGLIGHIFQHEMDHLEGILYIDKAKKLRSDEAREDLKEEFPA